MGEITLIFISLLAYLSIKGRLNTYIALATTSAPSSKQGGSQQANPTGKSNALPSLNPIPSQVSPTQNSLFNSLYSIFSPAVTAYSRIPFSNSYQVPVAKGLGAPDPGSETGGGSGVGGTGIFPFMPQGGPIQ